MFCRLKALFMYLMLKKLCYAMLFTQTPYRIIKGNNSRGLSPRPFLPVSICLTNIKMIAKSDGQSVLNKL